MQIVTSSPSGVDKLPSILGKKPVFFAFCPAKTSKMVLSPRGIDFFTASFSWYPLPSWRGFGSCYRVSYPLQQDFRAFPNGPYFPLVQIE
jgi:hypothetical protein